MRSICRSYPMHGDMGKACQDKKEGRKRGVITGILGKVQDTSPKGKGENAGLTVITPTDQPSSCG